MGSDVETETVFVGKKPVMNYVLACLTLFQNGATIVTVKARGRAISTAVDVAEILTKRFTADVSVKSIKIDTEQVEGDEAGETRSISSMEINLAG